MSINWHPCILVGDPDSSYERDTMKTCAASVISRFYWYGVIQQYNNNNNSSKEKSMSTTFNPFAFCCHCNYNKDYQRDSNDWTPHWTESYASNTWSEAAGVLRHFTSYSICSTVWLNLDCWFWISDFADNSFPENVCLEKFGSAVEVAILLLTSMKALFGLQCKDKGSTFVTTSNPSVAIV